MADDEDLVSVVGHVVHRGKGPTHARSDLLAPLAVDGREVLPDEAPCEGDPPAGVGQSVDVPEVELAQVVQGPDGKAATVDENGGGLEDASQRRGVAARERQVCQCGGRGMDGREARRVERGVDAAALDHVVSVELRPTVSDVGKGDGLHVPPDLEKGTG